MSAGSSEPEIRPRHLLEEAGAIVVVWHNVLSDCQSGIYLANKETRAKWIRALRCTGHGITARA